VIYEAALHVYNESKPLKEFGSRNRIHYKPSKRLVTSEITASNHRQQLCCGANEWLQISGVATARTESSLS
jgi:hypothetical protein